MSRRLVLALLGVLLLAVPLVFVWWGTRTAQETDKPVSTTFDDSAAETAVEPSISVPGGDAVVLSERVTTARDEEIDNNASQTTVDRAAYTELLYAMCRGMAREYQFLTEAELLDEAALENDEDLAAALTEFGEFIVQRRVTAADVLSAAGTPTSLHQAGLLHPERGVALLSQAADLLPNEPIVQKNYATACMRDEERQCDASAAVERLLRIDGDNSEVWVLSTLSKMPDYPDGALQALEIAATASRTSSYWPETAAAVYRGITASGTTDSSAAIIDSSTLPTEFRPNHGALMKICREQSQESERWAKACIDYGTIAAANYKTAIGRGVATAVAAVGFETIGDTEAAQEIRLVHRQKMDDASPAALNGLVYGSFVYNGDEYLRHLETIRMDGEIEAFRPRREIAADWVKTLDIADCAPGGEVPEELRGDLLDLKRIVGDG